MRLGRGTWLSSAQTRLKLSHRETVKPVQPRHRQAEIVRTPGPVNPLPSGHGGSCAPHEREEHMAPTRQEQHWMYRNMVTSRRFEETIAKIYFEGKSPAFNMANGPIPGEMHLRDGLEPVAVGVCAHLSPEDVVTATHRPHHQAIARGVHLDKMAAEIFARRPASRAGAAAYASLRCGGDLRLFGDHRAGDGSGRGRGAASRASPCRPSQRVQETAISSRARVCGMPSIMAPPPRIKGRPGRDFRILSSGAGRPLGQVADRGHHLGRVVRVCGRLVGRCKTPAVVVEIASRCVGELLRQGGPAQDIRAD